MTDKQIIIDGVDVSGCIYYDANADKESYFLHDCKKEHAPCWSCSSMPSCLYKKYKRKEQECEAYKMEAEEGIEINAELKAENKHLNDLLNQALKELEKTRETLTEIKSILEFYANSKMGEEQPDRTYKIMLNGSYVMVYDPKPARQALQKISEVEE